VTGVFSPPTGHHQALSPGTASHFGPFFGTLFFFGRNFASLSELQPGRPPQEDRRIQIFIWSAFP